MKAINGFVVLALVWCAVNSFILLLDHHHLELVDERATGIYLKDIPKTWQADAKRHIQILDLELELQRLRLKIERLEREAKHR